MKDGRRPPRLPRRCRSPRQHDRAGSGNQVQERREELRVSEAERWNERDVCQERSGRRARGIDGVQDGDLPPARALDVLPDTVADQQCQRAAHQQSAWPEQPEGNRTPRDGTTSWTARTSRSNPSHMTKTRPQANGVAGALSLSPRPERR